MMAARLGLASLSQSSRCPEDCRPCAVSARAVRAVPDKKFRRPNPSGRGTRRRENPRSSRHRRAMVNGVPGPTAPASFNEDDMEEWSLWVLTTACQPRPSRCGRANPYPSPGGSARGRRRAACPVDLGE